VLLADEPTGNLDTARSKEIMQLLSQLNSELGITILMVTHESEMAQFAQRLIHFVDGQVEHDSATNSAANSASNIASDKSRSPE
jgi:putative ABC transport system ATP-binding protein